ncbi:MAG: vWA domain-containing protein [Anaerolineae bacterium]
MKQCSAPRNRARFVVVSGALCLVVAALPGGLGNAPRVGATGAAAPQQPPPSTCTPTPQRVTPTPRTCPLADQWVVASSSDSAGGSAVVGSRDSSALGTDECRPFAYPDEVGHVGGLAVHLEWNYIYAAANHAPCRALGPGGPGAVYRIDLQLGWGDPIALLDAGPSRHSDPPTCPDEGARAWVGKTGLGDIELDAASDTLYVANLHDKRIYRVSAVDGSHIGSFAHGAQGEPWDANARLYGLAFHDGRIYHGVVDSREDDTLPGELRGYVYRSKPNGSSMELVAEVPLDYQRDPAWGPWHDGPISAGALERVQPLISDIEFRTNDDLVIGLRAREADMGVELASAYGDVLATRKLTRDSWEVVLDGPRYQDDGLVPELAFGGLAAAFDDDATIATARDPHGTGRGAGLLWFDNASGAIEGPVDGRELLRDERAPWLGDVEIACLRRAPAIDTPTPSATPEVTATATATPTASSTATAVFTSTPTGSVTSTATRTAATATPTASGTPTRAPEVRVIYLPIADRRHCWEAEVFSDVALVLDISTSMGRPTSRGRTKLAATIEAAGWFATHMPYLTPRQDGRGSQIGIVGFNDTAWIEQELTHDLGLILAGLERLQHKTIDGTRLDLAVERGAEAVSGTPHEAGNQQVVVLLTDGLPNRVPRAEDGRMTTTVLAAAQAAKDDGVLVITIALGEPEDTNRELLEAMATRPEMYYYMPDAEDLESVYAAIHARVACP